MAEANRDISSRCFSTFFSVVSWTDNPVSELESDTYICSYRAIYSRGSGSVDSVRLSRPREYDTLTGISERV